MRKVHWLYACAASVLLHAAAFLAIGSNFIGGGGPPPGQVVAEEGTLAGIIGSAMEIDLSEAPRETENVDQNLPKPVDVREPANSESAVETLPDELDEAPAETRVAMASPIETATDVPVLPQLAETQVSEDQFAMAAPVAKHVDTAELPQVEAKTVEPEENGKAPPPAASPRREEKRRILRELQKAEERNKRKATEADGKAEKTSRSQRLGNSAKEGSAGSSRGGGGKAGASSGALNSYAARVRSKILSRRPSSGAIGKVVISFGLSETGALRYAQIRRSSGNASFDRAALASVRGAAPFPPPPPGARASQLRFSIFVQAR